MKNFEETVQSEKTGYFYKIIGELKGVYNLFYIGKTKRQFITERLLNRYHKIKQAGFKKEHPTHIFYISLGIIENPIRIKDALVDNVESLLIYSCDKLNHKYFKNKSNTLSHKIIKSYIVKNKGFLEDGMKKEYAYGLFFK